MAYASASFDVTASVFYFDTTNYDYQYLDIIVYANNYSGIYLNSDWGPSESLFSKSKKYYCTTPNNNPLVFFDSLKDHLDFMFGRWKNYPTSLKLQNNVKDITKFVVITTRADFQDGQNAYNSYDSEAIKKMEDVVQQGIDIYNSVKR